MSSNLYAGLCLCSKLLVSLPSMDSATIKLCNFSALCERESRPLAEEIMTAWSDYMCLAQSPLAIRLATTTPSWRATDWFLLCSVLALLEVMLFTLERFDTTTPQRK